MEHFCTLFIFRGLFFNFLDTLFMQIPIEKRIFYKIAGDRYIQYMKTTNSEK